MKTVKELFDKAGGTQKLAYNLDLNQWTVLRWEKTGIPFKYWKTLIEKFKVTPDELTNMSHGAIAQFKKSLVKK
jgi:hypothetical protein